MELRKHMSAAHPGEAHAGGHPGGHPGGHLGGEHPHARFERQYASGNAPWDIGRPQPEIVALEATGVIGACVLDVGCGTGETALFLASRGHEVVGVDAVPVAIEQAREKAEERKLPVKFVAGDVLDTMPWIEGRPFDSVVDVGFFHALSDEQRLPFALELADALAWGGIYAMLCFSDRVPGEFGPRRVSEAEIRGVFAGPMFRVREVRAAELHSARPEMPVVDANLAIIERL
jgi:SAM-dependent methyltransferase